MSYEIEGYRRFIDDGRIWVLLKSEIAEESKIFYNLLVDGVAQWKHSRFARSRPGFETGW